MRLVTLLLLIASSVFAGDEDLSAKIANLARGYVGWGPEMSTPGASFTYREVSHDGRKRTYRVVVTGLLKDGAYALLQWPVTMDKPAILMNPVFIDATGVLLCKKGGNVNPSDDTVNLIMDSVRGEPTRSGVISLQDKSVRAFEKITARPLEAADKN